MAEQQVVTAINDSRLSVGEAVAIVALLAFIVGWIVLWTYDVEPQTLEDAGLWVTTVAVLVVGGPPMWAAGLVKRIIEQRP